MSNLIEEIARAQMEDRLRAARRRRVAGKRRSTEDERPARRHVARQPAGDGIAAASAR
jgi:hypothetical protein